MELRLLAIMLRQLPGRSILRARVGLDDGETPCSTSSSPSSSRGIGKAEEEDSLTVSAAWF